MTVGNSAWLLEAAQTCFMSPFPSPPQRRAGRGSHGCLGRAQASGDSMPWRSRPAALARPGPVWFSRVRFTVSQFLSELPCCSRAKLLRAAEELPGSACTHRTLTKQGACAPAEEAGEKTPVKQVLGSQAPCGESSARQKVAAPCITAFSGYKGKTQPCRC